MISHNADRLSRSARRRLARFARDNRGTTAIIFSLSLIPATGTLGVAVDYARAQTTRASLQAAVDAAALAAAIEYRASSNAAAAQQAASNTFNAAKGSTAATIATNTIDASTGKASFAASYTQSNYFMGVFGESGRSTPMTLSAEVTAASPAAGGLGMNLEVALMLDVTVSMAQNSGTPNLTKLAAMQQAARELIDTVVQTNQTPYKSRVALAPFSSAVNVGTQFKTFTGVKASGSWTSVVERNGAYAFTQDPPSAVAYFPSFKNKQSGALGSAGSYTQNLKTNVPGNAFVTALSSDRSALKTSIDAYTTSGSTAGHLGTAFSWYLLSPQWAGVWGTAGAPDAYDATKTLKVAVLMSDFDYNTHYQSANGNSSAQAAQLCANMKTAGVEIYTIGFQVDPNNTTAVNLFTNCATSAAHKIPAANGAQMIAAFGAIAQTVVAKASGGAKVYVSK